MSIRKARINEREEELSTFWAKLDVERHAKMQTEELSNAWKLQIESAVIKHNKECLEYQH